MTFYYDNQVQCKVSKISKGNFTQFVSFHKGGLISECFSIWSFPQNNVPKRDIMQLFSAEATMFLQKI